MIRRPAPAHDLERRLAALEQMDLEQLRAEWRSLMQVAPHPRLSADLVRRVIAFKLQEAATGGLHSALQRRLTATAPAKPGAGELKPGTLLVREWHGRTHTVQVLADGFDYQGRRFASLSKLAREITGAAWSGPRFFGLRAAAPGPNRGDA